MRLKPTRANSVHSSGYKFRLDKWTEVDDEDLDYLLSRYCPYSLVEDEYSGPYWVVNNSDRKSIRYFVDGRDRYIRLKTGKPEVFERHIAYQLLRSAGVEVPHLRDIVSKGSRVLAIRYGGLGDVLLTLPAIAAMREELGVRIDYSTSDALIRVVEHNEAIENVFGYHGWAGEDYDAVVDFRRYVEAASDSNSVHRSDLFARLVGVELKSYKMPYSVTDDEREEARSTVDGDYVVVQASGSIPRRTPPKHRTVEIVRRLVEAGKRPVIVDNIRDEDYSIDGAVNLTGTLSIPKLFAIIESASCVVAGDSGVMHAAVAVETRTIGLFGAVDAKLRVKEQPHCTVIQCNDWSGCPPCNDGQKMMCSNSDLCLDSVPIDLVVQEVCG